MGIDKSSALEILGEPDERSFADYEDNSSTETWEYLEIGLDLTFYSEDWLLGSITAKSKNTEFAGKYLIGMEEKEFLINAKEVGLEIELEDDFTELGSKDYVCQKLDLSFWIHDGELTSITIFPQYDESGIVPIWPE